MHFVVKRPYVMLDTVSEVAHPVGYLFLAPNTPEVGRPHAGSWKVAEAPWYQLDSSAAIWAEEGTGTRLKVWASSLGSRRKLTYSFQLECFVAKLQFVFERNARCCDPYCEDLLIGY